MKNINIEKSTMVLMISVLVIFILLLLRNAGIYTIVSSDEATYSKYSRLLPLASSIVPSYIYLAIYRLTNTCGDGFLSCARILNAFFFVAAAPFIYLTARHICTKSSSAIIVLLALLAPINSYTVYFMPESLYFFSFWVLTWFILNLNNSSKLSSWGFAGALLGIAGLVKPHAFLVLPAFVVFILYVCRKAEGKWVLNTFKVIGIFVLSTFVTKLLIGYLLVGKAGISIFGDFYSSIATSQAIDFQHYFKLLILSGENIKGHIMALCLMFSLPVALIINSAIKSLLSKEPAGLSHKFYFYTFIVLVNIILVVGVFTATVINTGPSETIGRLHMRYYSFLFPLLIIIAVSKLSLDAEVRSLKWRAIAALPVGVLILYAIYTHFTPFTPNFVDSPEMFGFSRNYRFLSGLSLLSLILWVFSCGSGTKLFVYLFLPLSVISSSFYVNRELRHRIQSDVYDRAGIFTKQYLPNEEISKMVIVGPEYGFLFRSLFHIDNPEVPLIGIPKGSIYNLNKIPAGKEWVLALGDNILPDDDFFQIPMDGFKLVHITSKNFFDFKKNSWPGVISSLRGLSQPEEWGTRSSGDMVSFEFCMPLPEKFKIHLVVHTFDLNLNEDLMIQVGDSKIKFKPGESPAEMIFEFINQKRSRTIKIYFATPVAIKEIGQNGKGRNLGLVFSKLQIIASQVFGH